MITAEPGAPSVSTNVALASNGATVTASSYLSDPVWGSYPATYVIDGSRRAVSNSVWLDNTSSNFSSDWVEVRFNGSKTISEIDVVTQQDNYQNPSEPTLTQTFSLYGITSFEMQYWTGSTWATVSGGSVTGNNKVWRQFTFTPVTTNKIRVMVSASAGNTYSRIVEVEAWTTSKLTRRPNTHQPSCREVASRLLITLLRLSRLALTA